MASSYTVIVFIALTLNGIGCLFIAYLLRRACKKVYSQKSDINNNGVISSTHPTDIINKKLSKWLWIFFIITMISSIFTCICNIILHIPLICTYLNGFQAVFASTQKVFLTFYQIGRLQSVFSSNQIHSNKYKGYKLYVFILLYINGILFGISASTVILASTDTYPIQSSDPNSDKFGCDYAEYDSMWFGIISLNGIWYYIWDWIVIGLYIHKIIQFRRSSTSNFDQSENENSASNSNSAAKSTMIQRIDSVLKKILLLTLIYELSGFLSVIQIFQLGPFGLILRPFDGTIPAMIIYLMLKCNHDEYIHILYKLKCCCICCECLTPNMSEQDVMDNIRNHRKHKGKKQREEDKTTDTTGTNTTVDIDMVDTTTVTSTGSKPYEGTVNTISVSQEVNDNNDGEISSFLVNDNLSSNI